MLPDRHPHLPPHNAEGLALGRLGGDAGQFFGTSGREGEDFRGDLAASGDFGEGPSDVTLGLPKPATNILSLFSISSAVQTKLIACIVGKNPSCVNVFPLDPAGWSRRVIPRSARGSGNIS